MVNLLNIFDNEEQLVLNNWAIGVSKNDFILAKLDFGIRVCTDNEVVGLLEGLRAKVSTLSDEEWQATQSLLPFDVIFSDEDIDMSEIKELDVS